MAAEALVVTTVDREGEGLCGLGFDDLAIDEEADVDSRRAIFVVDGLAELLDELGGAFDRVEEEVDALDDLGERGLEFVDLVSGEAHLSIAATDDAVDEAELAVFETGAVFLVGVGKHDHLVALCAGRDVEDGHLAAVFACVFDGEVADDSGEAEGGAVVEVDEVVGLWKVSIARSRPA